MEYLRSEQITTLQRVFTLFARERDGTSVVGPKELLSVLRCLSLPLSESDAADLLSCADLKGRGYLDFTEFVQLLTGELRSVDVDAELAAVWTQVSGGAGSVTPDQLRAFVATQQPDTSVLSTPALAPPTMPEIEALVKELQGVSSGGGGGRAGVLTRDDFLAAMRAQVVAPPHM